LDRYKKTIAEKRLESHFYFLPFQAHVQSLYSEVNAIVMPSRWEASGLLAMETLCMGRPLIASNCIGLRETVDNTPTISFASENVPEFVGALNSCIENVRRESFEKFSSIARQRFDVLSSAHKFVQLIEDIC
jgi:glycosyltransferase involved in cell wall biosynthesis